MKIIRSILFKVILLFAIALSLLIFLLTTPPGIYTLVKLVNLNLPGTLQFREFHGNFMDKLYFAEVVYDDEDIRYQLNNVHLRWKPIQFLWNKVSINTLTADQVLVQIKKAPPTIEKTAAIEYPPPNLPFELSLHRLWIKNLQIKQINVSEHLTKIHLSADYKQQQWRVHQLTLNYKNWLFAAQGSVHAFRPYKAYADLQVTALPKHPASVQSNLHLQGDMHLYSLRGNLQGPATGNLTGTFKDGTDLLLTTQWKNGKWPDQPPYSFNSPQGTLTLQGTLKKLKIQANAAIKTPIAGDLNIQGTWVNSRLEAKLLIGENQINLNGTGPYRWKANFFIPKPENLYPNLQGVRTLFSGEAEVQNPQQGNLSLKIHPGVYNLPENPSLPAVAFKGGVLRLTLNAKELQGEGEFIIDAQKNVNTRFRLPKFRLNSKISSAQQIIGNLNLRINSLDFLQGLSKNIEKPQGKLSISLDAKGTLKTPNLQGNLALTQGGIYFPKLNTHIQPIEATLKSKDKHWQLNGFLSESGRQISIKGDGIFSPQVTGKISLAGDNFPLMKTAEYTIDISPKLNILIQPQSCTLQGSILIPQADLKPISFSNTVNLTEDAVIVKNEPQPKPLPFNLNMDVEITMGQKVALKVKGLQGFLDGIIHVKQLPQGEPYATGELNVREGKYQAYGQKLDIEQGQLLFTGGSLDNPGVRIRAVRTFNNTNSQFAGSSQLFDFNPENLQNYDFNNKTTVGIELSGRLNSTKVKLFSIPPNLSQADILSMLILGRPANQANKSGARLLLTAISSMNLDSGTKGLQLVDQLKQTLGLDFDVQNTSEYNQKTNQMNEGTAFVVGKALTNRLYLSYNIGLLQEDVNVLTLKYLLNQFFSLQVSTSDSGSGIDLLYTHSKD
jgi:translocation and assembly module TamB